MKKVADFTAVVLSPEPVDLFSDVNVINHVSKFTDTAGLRAARLEAIAKVTTKYFAFVDSDDELVAPRVVIPEFITKLRDAKAVIGYSNWVEKSKFGTKVIIPGSYSLENYIRFPTLMHQITLMDTTAALEESVKIPPNTLAEFPLYFLLCLRTAPVYFPKITYIWNRGETGLHRAKDFRSAQDASTSWAKSLLKV